MDLPVFNRLATGNAAAQDDVCKHGARMAVTEVKPMPPNGARSQSASARIVREVIRGLYEGTYVSGQRLSEPELMEQFNVSRSTVREAIRRMESEGVVDVLPHRGAVIRKLTRDEAINALLVMELCIGLAARLAAERINESDNRATFETVWSELLKFEGTPDCFDFVKARDHFHRTITEISGNRELQRILPSIHVHLIRRVYSLSPDTRFEHYRKLADAILVGDGVTAEAAAREHVVKIFALVRQSPADPDRPLSGQEG